MSRLALSLFLLLTACTPSQEAIQTAIAQTMAAATPTQAAGSNTDCIAWGRIDKSYAGEWICIRGIVESKIVDVALTFSSAPNTPYITWHPWFVANNYSAGNCVIAYGYVGIDQNQTPYITPERVSSCP